MEILVAIVMVGIWVTIASLNYKLGRLVRSQRRIASSLERIAEVELPVMTAAISEFLDPLPIDIANLN